MGENSLEKDVDIPSAKDLKEQFGLTSSGRENENKKTETRDLSNKQIQEVKHLLSEYNGKHPGTTCERDEVKYLAFLERDCSPDQRDAAIAGISEHLKIKQEHLDKYMKNIQEHFLVDDQLVPEGARLIKDYKDMTGEERKEASEKLEDIIEKRIQEKKDYKELIKESPHFDEDSPHAQQLLIDYQEAEGAQKTNLKRRLLKEIEKLERAEKRCENLYTSANKAYEEGDFSHGARALVLSIKLADRYPNSPRLQVISEWSQRDLRNIQDHIREQSDIDGAQEEYNELVIIGDLPAAEEVANILTRKTGHFLNYTTNRDGAEVVRKDKYKTAYLQALDYNARADLQAVQGLQNEAIEEEERQNSQNISEEFVDYYTGSDQGFDHAVKTGVAEEETRQFHEEDRTDDGDVLKRKYLDTEDIEGYTEEDLSEKTKEQEAEVAVNLDKADDHERLRIISRSDEINTGIVTNEGEGVTNIQKIENLLGQQTKRLKDDFIQKARADGTLSEESIAAFDENLQRRITSGEFGRAVTDETRTTGPDFVRFGRQFEESRAEVGEFIAGQGQGVEESKGGDQKIINLAQKIEQQKRDHMLRRAA